MNLRVLPGLLAWTFVSPFAAACGPFFPDTVLDKPQAALDVPPVSYLAELHRIAGTPMPTERFVLGETPFLAQIPLEVAQLRMGWREAGVPEQVIEDRIKRYTEVRQVLLTGLETVGRSGFPIGAAAAGALPLKPLEQDFPRDVADYVEGARLHAIGRTEEARALWKGILERPAAEKRLRGIWAAWMLAKTSGDPDECLRWYERVDREEQEGAIDLLNLAAAAKSWRASAVGNPIESLRLFYDAFRSGKEGAALDIRNISAAILEEKNDTSLKEAAADPVLRRLLNLHLQALLDGPGQNDRIEEEAEPGAEQASLLPPNEWLAALAATAPLPLEDGSRLAWALYAAGRYDEAAHWLTISRKDEPLARWLQAKFDLRAGNLEAARRNLAAAEQVWSMAADWKPGNPYLESMWMDAGTERLQGFQGRLLADAGMVALASADVSAATVSLVEGGYDEDAAYLAERVLSTDELLKLVRAKAPAWEPAPDRPQSEEEDYRTDDSDVVDPATCLEGDMIGNYSWHMTAKNRLRYELARRLGREGRLDEAAEFMPPSLKRLFDHYRSLHAARTSGRYSGEALAAITWREARLHRSWGAELFSTDTFPDGGIHGWSFEAEDLSAIRSHRHGWTVEWNEQLEIKDAEVEADRAVPLVLESEIERVKRHPLPNTNRFHYRYVAADLAMKAAESLPDNHPQLAPLYNTAGQWLAARNPQAADPLYQAMVKRCKDTPMGQAADKKRWFIGNTEALQDLPGLPDELMPKKP
ncbi:hypothetical protein KBB96_11515 [Luteolibacter ambystomatis]|uniref:Tetratricopeptide repeat protein n=1 Tax=Luteolibacter ambystomatis TaxID=2824561 RepID=A0A975IXN1_9BACT|nr:hypothetical protein [Luteolibacter ambystomatis]QUE49501.1 hypothetical protein KBB96_11515 [Luteolibacter ambystomatis]